METAEFKDINVQFFRPKLINYESAIVYAQHLSDDTLTTFQHIRQYPEFYFI